MNGEALVPALLRVLAVVVVVVVAAAWFGQRRVVFPIPDVPPPRLPAPGVEFLPLPEGHAFLLPPLVAEGGRAPLVVFAHGNAEVAHAHLNGFQALRERGCAILLLEYPGYAGSRGAPSAASIEKSALMALDQVLARTDIDPERVVPYGRSLGGGAACRIALRRPVAALVLESTFESLARLASAVGMPAFLLRDRFDNGAVVAQLDVPVFVYHGTRDEVVPFAHGAALADRARDVTFVTADCGHSDCPRPERELIGFLEAKGILGRRDAGS